MWKSGSYSPLLQIKALKTGSFKDCWLVVFLEHDWMVLDYFPIFFGNKIIIPTDELIFFRGVEATNQDWKILEDDILNYSTNSTLSNPPF